MKVGGLALILLFFFKWLSHEVTLEEKQVIRSSGDFYLERLEQMGFQCPTVVVAQMVHETGFFTSDIYKKGNNLFGMKKAHHRPGEYQKGTYKGHASYESPAHSLLDYLEFQQYVALKWLKRRNKNRFNSDEEYMQFLLDCGYAEDKAYIKKLKKYIKIINDGTR